MFKYPTVASLSEFLIEDMFKGEMPEEEPKVEVVAVEEEETLDDLGEEEREARLNDELGEETDDGDF